MASVSNATIRARAQDAVNYNLPRIIMLHLAAWVVPAGILLIALPELVTQFVSMADISASSFAAVSDTYIVSSVMRMLGGMGLWGLLAGAVALTLNTGLVYGLQQLGSRVTVKGGVVLSRWKHALGSIGLNLWTGVKIFAWGLPGELVISLSVLLAPQGSESLAWMELAGQILYAALVIPATLRYALAIHVFADTPEVGAFDAVERSKQLMACRKWQLFCLTLPYALGIIGVWAAILVIFVVFASIGAVGPFVSWLLLLLVVAAVCATVYLGFLTSMAVACYYNAHKLPDAPMAIRPAAPPVNAPAPVIAEAPVQEVAQETEPETQAEPDTQDATE